jgi:hypothetical protein
MLRVNVDGQDYSLPMTETTTPLCATLVALAPSQRTNVKSMHGKFQYVADFLMSTPKHDGETRKEPVVIDNEEELLLIRKELRAWGVPEADAMRAYCSVAELLGERMYLLRVIEHGYCQCFNMDGSFQTVLARDGMDVAKKSVW